MTFDLQKSISILERTPAVLHTLLSDLDEDWTHQNEGGESWSAYDIVGHFIHGELTDWIPRMTIILSDSDDRTFIPFDRFAQFENSKGKTLSVLLAEFEALRIQNVSALRNAQLNVADLERRAIHPELGPVNLAQLLSAWTVHDLGHIAQISRVMAKQYQHEVGPWTAYLGILNQQAKHYMIQEFLPYFYKFLDQLRNEIEQYQKEEQLWLVPSEINNSAGTLCVHLIGNLNHFIGFALGGTGYIRNRPLEFTEQVSKVELLERLAATRTMLGNVLNTVEDLQAPYPEGLFDKNGTIQFQLLRLLSHLSYHVGQVNYHRRLLAS